MAIATLKMLTLDSSDARRDATLLDGGARLGGRARAGRVRDAHRARRPGPRVRDGRGPRGAGVAERARQQAVPPRPRRRRPRRGRSPRASSWGPRSPTSSPARRGGCCSTRAATRSASPSRRTGADAADGPLPGRWTRARPPARPGQHGGVEGVVLGFATIVGGHRASEPSIAHLGVVDLGAQQVLSRIAFFVASPALLLTTVAEADVHDVLSRSLIATVVGVAVVVARLLGGRLVALAPQPSASGSSGRSRARTSTPATSGSRSRPTCSGTPPSWHRPCCSSCCVLQPLALALLDADVRGRRPRVGDFLLRPFTNPLTIGTLLGLLLSITGWRLPPIVADPVELIGAMAVPGMLLAYGIALRLGPGFGGGVPAGELTLTSILKLARPAGRRVGHGDLALGLDGPRAARRRRVLEPADGAEHLRPRDPLRPRRRPSRATRSS